jgi:putative oxidoreductase
MKTRWIAWAARAVGALFVYAGAAKLTAPAEFATSVRSFHLAPAEWTAALALTIPFVEIVSGAGVWIAPGRRVHLLSLFLLTLAFFGALVSAAVRGLDADCGCFGAWSQSSLGLAIARDVLLAGILGFLYVRCDAKKTSRPA